MRTRFSSLPAAMLFSAAMLGCGGSATDPGPQPPAPPPDGKNGNRPGDTLPAVLETLPKDLWPRDKEDTIRFDKAEKWFKDNVVGREASVTCHLEKVAITPPTGPGGKYSVHLSNAAQDRLQVRVGRYVFKDRETLQPTYGLEVWGRRWDGVELRTNNDWGVTADVDEAGAERLQALKGSDARLTFTIVDVRRPGGAEPLTVRVKDCRAEDAKQ